jgi:group I intron endonuclease
LKYGHSAFSLYILEYCSVDDLLAREQYYFDSLSPKYNICKVAGSTLGRLHSRLSKEKISKTKSGTNIGEANHFSGKLHSEEARKKMSEAKLNRTLTAETRKKISTSMTGMTFSEEHKLNLSISKKNSKKLSVLNILTNEETIFHSVSQAERSLGIPKGAIGLNLKSKSGAPYRGIYKFTLHHND